MFSVEFSISFLPPFLPHAAYIPSLPSQSVHTHTHSLTHHLCGESDIMTTTRTSVWARLKSLWLNKREQKVQLVVLSFFLGGGNNGNNWDKKKGGSRVMNMFVMPSSPYKYFGSCPSKKIIICMKEREGNLSPSFTYPFHPPKPTLINDDDP